MTFDPFGDFNTRGYLRNHFAEKDPAVIQRQEHHAFRLNVGRALDALAARPSLTYQDLLDTHGRLFSDVYPWAGQDRQAVLPGLAVGKAGRYDLFAHPFDVRRAAEYGLDLGQQPDAMANRPGEVIGLLADAHPFLDGNGRSIMTLHAELSRRAGIHVEWDYINKAPYLRALTQELTEPGRGHLDALLRPYVQPRALPLTELSAELSRNSGLGPVAAATEAVKPKVVSVPAPQQERTTRPAPTSGFGPEP